MLYEVITGAVGDVQRRLVDLLAGLGHKRFGQQGDVLRTLV